MDLDETDAVDALQVVSLLAKMKQSMNFTYSPWSALAEIPSSLESLVRCLAEFAFSGAIVLDDLLVEQSRSIGSLTNRKMNSSSLGELVELSYSLVLQRNVNRLQWMHLMYQDI
ncbi:hypothetical protein PVL29_011937 [Vitis rotundifolia]|uniref:Uncharacterized protein n=1 Tax=Vitis rotundifolia TaxID=103349 RepID=A0AA39DQ76_VITRO|nr:hypothetical protein PVL29_011937 [Vitis rotundifolia]